MTGRRYDAIKKKEQIHVHMIYSRPWTFHYMQLVKLARNFSRGHSSNITQQSANLLIT